MEVQNAQKQNRLVPFINFLFRFSDSHATEKAVEELLTNDRLVSNAYGNRPCTRQPHSGRGSPTAGPLARFPEELLDHPWPNVM